jgi:hypothetical protein
LAAVSAVLAQDEGQLQSEFRREGQQIGDDCTQLKKIFSCLEVFATGKPLHIGAGSIAPQNGFALGPAFVYDKNLGEAWRLSTNADGVISMNGSWRTGLYLKAIHTPNKPPVPVTTRPTGPPPVVRPAAVPEFNFYTQAISLQQLDYYGEGQFTSRPSLGLFGMTQTIAGGNVLYPLFGSSGLALFGELNGRWVSLRSREGQSSPSIQQVYSDATAPGLTTQPGFLQTGEGLKFARSLSDRLQLNYSTVLQQFTAVSDSRYSFRRLTLDFDHVIPIYRRQAAAARPVQGAGPDESAAGVPRFSRNREGSVELRALLVESFTGSNSVVPFYFQPTLGGSDINGQHMLPSYPDYRFRAPNMMLYSASFEHSIWGPIGGMLMAQTGRVAETRGDLGFDHLRHSYGAGLTIRAGGLPQVLLLFAWGGHEGTHTIAYISPFLLGGGSRPSLY